MCKENCVQQEPNVSIVHQDLRIAAEVDCVVFYQT